KQAQNARNTPKNAKIRSKISCGKNLPTSASFFPVLDTIPNPSRETAISLEERCAWLLNLGHIPGSLPLHHAASNGNEAMLRILLDGGVFDVNATNEEGLTALGLASKNGHAEIVRTLSQIPGIDLVTGDPIKLAIENAHARIVEMLLAMPGLELNPTDLLESAIAAGDESVVLIILKVVPDAVLQEIPLLTPAIQNHNLLLIQIFLDYGKDFDINANQPLCQAVRLGFGDVVDLLIERAKGLDMVAGSPIRVAVEMGHTEIAAKLIQKTNDPGISADQLLKIAIERGHVDTVSTLLDSGLNLTFAGLYPLVVAIQKKDPLVLKALLSHASRFDVNAEEPLWLAVEKKQPEIVKILLEECPGLDVNAGRTVQLKKKFGAVESISATPLLQAVLTDAVELAALLVKHPETDTNRSCPIRHAIERNNLDMLNLLLTLPNLKKDMVDDNGDSQLLLAVKYSNIAAVRALIDRGWPVNQTNPLGLHPLHVALDKRCVEIIEMLLGAEGINVNVPDRDNKTPLHWAIGDGFTEGVNLLLGRKDIDLHHRDNRGYTPIKLAKNLAKVWNDKPNYQEIRKMMESYGNPSSFMGIFSAST
ncbi:MAG: Phosphocholine transferase AnkX, partial [Pseudomonadota bacterium]